MIYKDIERLLENDENKKNFREYMSMEDIKNIINKIDKYTDEYENIPSKYYLLRLINLTNELSNMCVSKLIDIEIDEMFK